MKITKDRLRKLAGLPKEEQVKEEKTLKEGTKMFGLATPSVLRNPFERETTTEQVKEKDSLVDTLADWLGNYKYGMISSSEIPPEARDFFVRHNFDIPAMEAELEKMQAKRLLANEQKVDDSPESRWPGQEDEEEARAMASMEKDLADWGSSEDIAHLRVLESKAIRLANELLALLDKMHDYEHAPKVDDLLRSMKKIYKG
jgi:hypothetical protein